MGTFGAYSVAVPPDARHSWIRPFSAASLRARLVAGWAVLVLFLAGCSPDPVTEKSLDIDPGEVELLEVFQYSFFDAPTFAVKGTITDEADIASVIDAFTDIPTTPYDGDQLRAYEETAYGLRFHLTDGSTVELTQIFLREGDGASIVFFPDGSVDFSEWGYRIGDYYDATSDWSQLDVVPPSEIPEASLAPE